MRKRASVADETGSPFDFAAAAPTWSSRYLSGQFSDRLDAIAALLGPEKRRDTFWIDAGCGSGFMTHWFAERYQCRLHGVDISPEMIAHAAETDQVKFEVADILNLPQLDESFDGGICSSVVQFVDEPERLIRELARVLKPGAPLLISSPMPHKLLELKTEISRWRHRLSASKNQFRYPLRRYSEKVFCTKLRALGFTPIASRSFGRPAIALGTKRIQPAFLGHEMLMVLARREDRG